jgi:hypothetical protein
MEGPSDKVRPLSARLACADALLRQAASDNAGGFGMNGAMDAGMRMMVAGLSMGQIQSVNSVVLAYTRGQVGAEAIDKAVVAIPGLSQFT